MSTTFDALERLYPVLNVVSVTTLLDGRVYRRKKPLNSEKRDIVIVPLELRDGDGLDVQPGTTFINAFAPNFSDGRPNESTLNTIADMILKKISAFSQGSTYCHFEVISENLMQDQDQPNMSYVSIRLRNIIQ